MNMNVNIDAAPDAMREGVPGAPIDDAARRAASAAAATARFLPWVVASALFMEQLDTTIVNTCIPAMAASFHAAPLSSKTVSASYILSLAVAIPASGWLADRFGSRRIFLLALALFAVSSTLCGLALDLNSLVAARIPQGIAAAMMLPVGRMAIVRMFPKAQLLRAMNFVIIPALLGPLLGPTLGGVIAAFALIDHSVPRGAILLLAFMMGLFNSLQFSSMNSLAYADISSTQVAMASTMASAAQQMSMSFGLGLASLVTGLAQTSAAAVVQALHHAFLALASLTVVSSLSFRGLCGGDGDGVSLAGAHQRAGDTEGAA